MSCLVLTLQFKNKQKRKKMTKKIKFTKAKKIKIIRDSKGEVVSIKKTSLATFVIFSLN